MQRTRTIIKALSIQPYLRFYEIMKYPVPKKAELFFQYSDTENTNANKLLKNIAKKSKGSKPHFNQFLSLNKFFFVIQSALML